MLPERYESKVPVSPNSSDGGYRFHPQTPYEDVESGDDRLSLKSYEDDRAFERGHEDEDMSELPRDPYAWKIDR